MTANEEILEKLGTCFLELIKKARAEERRMIFEELDKELDDSAGDIILTISPEDYKKLKQKLEVE